MNPRAAEPTFPAALGGSLWRQRQLILQMTRRDMLGCYKGSFMGLARSFFTPLLILAAEIWFQKTKGFADGLVGQTGLLRPPAVPPAPTFQRFCARRVCPFMVPCN